LEPNFDKIVIEWSFSKIVSGSSAVSAILVGGMKCRTQFWKGTTQGSFQQSLVEIGSVVIEEKSLKPFAQLEPNFDKIVIEWFFSKIVSGGPAF
jgi:hypothetical protein